MKPPPSVSSARKVGALPAATGGECETTFGNVNDARPSRRWARILTISDEIQLLKLVRSILKPHRFHTAELSVLDAAAAPDSAVDIVIVDVDRFNPDVVRIIRRQFPAAEIIKLCRAYHESDLICGIEMGVECLARPFRNQDLLMRVHAAELRRLATLGHRQYYRLGSLVIDMLARQVTRKGRQMRMTSAELRVLALLARDPGRLVTFEELLVALGRRAPLDRRQSVRAVVGALRDKLQADRECEVSIENENRVGYRLVVSGS